jgi:hypothetical protein
VKHCVQNHYHHQKKKKKKKQSTYSSSKYSYLVAAGGKQAYGLAHPTDSAVVPPLLPCLCLQLSRGIPGLQLLLLLDCNLEKVLIFRKDPTEV